MPTHRAQDTIAQRLGRAIAARRAEAGKTQGEIAEALEVEQQTVSRWELGSRSPSLETLDRLAILLNCTIVDFLRTASGRKSHQLLNVEAILNELTEAESALVVDHIQKFAALLKSQRTGR